MRMAFGRLGSPTRLSWQRDAFVVSQMGLQRQRSGANEMPETVTVQRSTYGCLLS